MNKILEKSKKIEQIKNFILNFLKKILKLLKILFKIFLVFLIISILMIFLWLFKYSDLTKEISDNNWVPNIWNIVENQNILTPEEYRRWEDQTFLTFPEWFLVFAPQWQADFLNKNTNSNYPYLADTAGIWQSYKIVYDKIKNKYEFNWGYNLMIMVISTSSSIEYDLKSLYESTLWSIFDTEINKTYEDKFYAKFANDYVNFIYNIPWYEFDFLSELKEFNWNNTFFWDNIFRKTERKIVINIELYTKYLYSKLIKLWTQWVYDPALPNTVVLIDKNINNLVSENNIDLDKIKLIKTINTKNKKYYLVSIPRYDKFKDYSSFLAKNDINFIEIAWNNWDILISVLIPKTLKKLNINNIDELFEQKIITNNNKKRIVFTTKVWDIKEVLNQIDDEKIILEHVFDY